MRADEDFQIEISDLNKSDTDGPALYPALTHWQRKRRRYWRVASTVCILLLLGVVFNLSNGFFSILVDTARTALSANENLDTLSLVAFHPGPAPQQDGITCLMDAAWSPDGKTIAVLGYREDCTQEGYLTGQLNLYDARTDALITELHPDIAILHALNGPLPAITQSFASKPSNIGRGTKAPIYYWHVLWSPDGQHVACLFEMAAEDSSVHGVVLVSAGNQQMQVIMQRGNLSARLYAEWDLGQSGASGTYRQPKALAPGSLPSALAYHWEPGGKLVPETPLSNTFVPAARGIGAVGNPDGSSRFTVWQSGVADLVALRYLSYRFPIYTWQADFAAWSPDGRYLVDEVGVSGLIEPSGQPFPPRKVLRATGMFGIPHLPVRDAALLQVGSAPTAIAWSPDGHLLATYDSRNMVNLYDCASGHMLASFFLRTNYASPLVNAVVMRWSPDGTRLLLSSVVWGLVALWSPLQFIK